MHNEISERKFSSKARLKSFGYAFNGLLILLREEHNAVIQFIILTIVIIAGILLDISGNDWLVIIIAGMLVIASECFNTAIERLSDCVTHENDDRIKKVKDLSAAAVLISAIGSTVAGMIIFIPEIIELLGS
jgi:diacylglycerol kinase